MRSGAAQRIRSMSAAVAAVAEYAEGRMTESASAELIRSAMDWSAIGAVGLIPALAEAGATSYSDGAVAVIADGFRRDEAACDVAVALVAHLVIPIATSGEAELLSQLMCAVEHQGGRSRVEVSVSVLRHAIDVLALPTARPTWMSGLRDGLVACDLDPEAFGIPPSEEAKETRTAAEYGGRR